MERCKSVRRDGDDPPAAGPAILRRQVRERLLAVLQGVISPDNYTMLRGYWMREAEARGERSFEDFWTRSLRDGVVAGSEAAPVDVTVRDDLAAHLRLPPSAPSSGGSLQALFRPDDAVWDGRFANNGWLQEMPRWVTTLTWDNAALVAPETAQRLSLANEDLVELRTTAGTVRAPVLIQPGLAANCVALPLGQGRSAVGQVGAGVGFDAYRLRNAEQLWQGAAIELVKVGGRWPLALRQHHQTIDGRDIVRTGALDDFLHDHDFLRKIADQEKQRRGAVDASLYPEIRYDGNAWAMAINLNSCIGCSACVLACQAENNIPVVGKDAGPARPRDALDARRPLLRRLARRAGIVFPAGALHALRDAPCEMVCPVQRDGARRRGPQPHGLQPLRRHAVSAPTTAPTRSAASISSTTPSNDPGRARAANPDVSVRGRGVMEKCTYCIQRIREAKIVASRENRAIRDGEVVTACQQACPTEAIVFGDRNMPESAVARRKASALDYSLLDELNTRPRTTSGTPPQSQP